MSDVEANEERCKNQWNQWYDPSQEAGQWNGIHGTGGVNGWTKYHCHSWYWDTLVNTQTLLLFAHGLTLNFHNVWLLFYGQCATDLWRLHKRWIVRNETMKKTLPGFETASGRTTIHGYLNTSGRVTQCLGFSSMTTAAVKGFLCCSTKPPACTSFSTPCSSLATVPTAMVLKPERKDWTWKEKRKHISHLYMRPPTSLQI